MAGEGKLHHLLHSFAHSASALFRLSARYGAALKKAVGFRELLSAYLSWYVVLAPSKAALINLSGKAPALRRAVAACRSLHKTYYPTIWAPTAALQMLMSQVRECAVRGGLVASPYSCREVLTLADGQDMVLDWALPSSSPPSSSSSSASSSSLPVVVVHHGAFQTSRSAAVVAIVKQCAAAGFPVVAVNRRGYETPLTVQRYNIFGLDDDMDEVLRRSVVRRFPGRAVSIKNYWKAVRNQFGICLLSHMAFPSRGGSDDI